MSSVFRAKFVAELRKNKKDIDQRLFDVLFSKKWVVFAKKTFSNTHSVVEYLGRYSHEIAISNHRIVKIDTKKDTLTFKIKNYKKGGKRELLTLSQAEFIRRFSMHVLPKGFTRIRHYGILSGTWKKKHLKKLQAKLSKGIKKATKVKKTLLNLCKVCKKGELSIIHVFDECRPPPKEMITQMQNYNA